MRPSDMPPCRSQSGRDGGRSHHSAARQVDGDIGARGDRARDPADPWCARTGRWRVARERLREATEAFELAERQERELEADYDAWLLLLEQMRHAEAAQASNLGQTLAPAIAGRFEALAQRRYEGVRLTAQLGTEGVVVAGTVRPTARISHADHH